MKKRGLMRMTAMLTAGMLFLTACGGSAGSGTSTAASTAGGEASTAATEQSAAQPAEQSTAEATEGGSESSDRPYYVRDPESVGTKLTVYTTMEETQQTVLKEIWEKYYPDCALEIQADSVGTLATKIRSDETSDADIVIGGMFAADGDTYHDILQPYVPACDAEQNYHDPSGYYTFYDVQVMCLVVNPELRDELGIEIKGYQDLLNPALEGKIILADPASASSGWRQLQTILAVMGDSFDDEKGWAYIEELLPLSFSTTSSKDVFNLVINGEYVAGLSYESSVVALIEDGAQVECVYMEEGNTAMAGGAAMVKDCPNQAGAEAMLDLLSSAEFQEARAYASSGRPSNGNCNLEGLLPDDSTLGLVDLDYDYLSANKEAMLTKWNDLMTR